MMNIFLGLSLIGLAIFIGLIFLVVWIWALIDCIKSDTSGEYKLIWLLIIIFANIIGAILYFIFAKEFDKDRKINFTGKQGKYLTRSSENKIIGGVCGGLAEHFSFDPAIIRILWVVFTIFVNGVGILLYLIAWVAIPSDKSIRNVNNKDKGDEKDKGKPKDKSTRDFKNRSSKSLKNEPKKKKPGFLAVMLTLFVFVLLFMFVAGFVILGNLNYNDSDNRISVKNFIVDVKSEVNEKIIIDEIKSSHNYKNFDGYNLTLLEVIEPSDDSCTLFERDPYGVTIYDSGCREFKHRFFVESESFAGYDVNTLVSGGRILKMTFTSFLSIPQDEPVNSNSSTNLIKCDLDQLNADVCIEVYDPVCGFENNSSIRDGVEFSNACFACQNPKINYYIEGSCQK